LARELWEAIREIWPRKERISNTGKEWLFDALDKANEKERMMMLMTLWRIWHVRNEVIHQKAAPPVEALRRFLRSYVESLLMIKQAPTVDPVKGKTPIVYDHRCSTSACRRKEANIAEDTMAKWVPPSHGWAKINVDGAWAEDKREGGTGMILRDDEGCITVAACRHLQVCDSPLEAEILACNEGLALALEYTNKPIIIESDCLEATTMINDLAVNRSKVAALVHETKRLCKLGRQCLVRHVRRGLNGVSHTLARMGLLERCSNVWVRHGPDIIRQACIQDGTPIP
jgi:ribonuclease HI